MIRIRPSTAEELAEALQSAASGRKTINVEGNNSKRLMGGPVPEADVVVSTAGMRRVLQYEPNDLTVSVEAGMPMGELQSLLANRGQMIALDPPFASQATVGGVVASNTSGPMRLAYGTARDLVIGMKFATLEGKIISSGGMVVKNVAGLDMGKLMIGSFGTLAVMTSVNFRLHLLPEETRTFVFAGSDVQEMLEKRDWVMKSILQPMALDLISPAAAARLGRKGNLLALRAGGSEAVLNRYARELGSPEELRGQEDRDFWQQVTEFSADFLRRQQGGIVLRFSTTVTGMRDLLRLVTDACTSRAASGVTYIHLPSWQGVPGLWKAAAENGWAAVVEFAPDQVRADRELWQVLPAGSIENAFAMMKKVKQMFDPNYLMNRSRLYGRI